MKTAIKLVAALPAFALITACSMMNPSMPEPPATTTPTIDMPSTNISSSSIDSVKTTTNTAYDRMAPVPYSCTDNSSILAKQSINKKQATITATVPKLNWSQQQLILIGGVQGDTASYVNDSNPEIIYAWHMQGDEGVLAMKWASGQTYQVDCKIGR